MAKHIRPSHFPTSFFDQQSLTFLRILHSYSSSFKVIHAHNAGLNIERGAQDKLKAHREKEPRGP